MAKNLWNYYGITDVIFAGTAGNIWVTDDMNGTNRRSLESLNMSADIDVTTQVLSFQANGSPIVSDCYLQIPVQIKPYWGTLKANMYIKIKHTL